MTPGPQPPHSDLLIPTLVFFEECGPHLGGPQGHERSCLNIVGVLMGYSNLQLNARSGAPDMTAMGTQIFGKFLSCVSFDDRFAPKLRPLKRSLRDPKKQPFVQPKVVVGPADCAVITSRTASTPSSGSADLNS